MPSSYCSLFLDNSRFADFEDVSTVTQSTVFIPAAIEYSNRINNQQNYVHSCRNIFLHYFRNKVEILSSINDFLECDAIEIKNKKDLLNENLPICSFSA